jgi:hypothetical protein
MLAFFGQIAAAPLKPRISAVELAWRGCKNSERRPEPDSYDEDPTGAPRMHY